MLRKITLLKNQRGAEMVEYAIVLACIAVLAGWYYGTRDKQNNGNATFTLYKVIETLWTKISSLASSGAK